MLMTGGEDKEELWSNKHVIDKDYVAKRDYPTLFYWHRFFVYISEIRMEVSGMCSCDIHTQSGVHSIWLGELLCSS